MTESNISEIEIPAIDGDELSNIGTESEQPTGVDFLKAEIKANAEADRIFKLMAGRLGRGETVSGDDIDAVVWNAKKSYEDLLAEVGHVKNDILPQLKRIDDEALNTRESTEFFIRHKAAKQEHERAVEAIRDLIIDCIVNRRILYSANFDCRKRIERRGDAAKQAISELRVMGIDEYGFEMPQRTPMVIPEESGPGKRDIEWETARVRSRIIQRFEAMLVPGSTERRDILSRLLADAPLPASAVPTLQSTSPVESSTDVMGQPEAETAEEPVASAPIRETLDPDNEPENEVDDSTV